MRRPLIFDLFNTLLDGADHERDRVLREMATMIDADPDALIGAYHDSWPERLIRWDAEETIRILAGRLGVRPGPARIAQAAEHRRALARRILRVVPTATLDVLDRLRADGHRLALISNATSDTAEAWPESPLAGRFDVAIFSSVIGLAKPDPAIYRAAADRLGTDPADCVYIGDGADDELAGAAAVGMSTIRTTQFRDHCGSGTETVIVDLLELTPENRATVRTTMVHNRRS
jgi:putative hydrolase of the HAD superfamily